MNDLKSEIIDLLQSEPETRSDDRLLYSRLIEIGCSSLSEDVIRIFSDIWINGFKYGIPNFKTVVRLRADIQRDHPELIDRDGIKLRKELERKFRLLFRRKRGDNNE